MRSAARTACAIALVAVAWSRAAAADSPSREPDATYGRIEGDLALVGGVGASFGPSAPRLALDLRFRYLDTVGVFVDYEDGPAVGSSADPRRLVAGGLELRPLFLARWLTGTELSRGRLDLLVDSFGLELGAFVQQPYGATFGQRPGVEAGIGLEVPIFAHASGPWIGLHGGVRWSDAVLNGGAINGPEDRALYLAVTLSWHQLFLTHAVDAGDGPPK